MIAAIISVLIVLGILRLIPATRELGSDAAIAAVILAAGDCDFSSRTPDCYCSGWADALFLDSVHVDALGRG